MLEEVMEISLYFLHYTYQAKSLKISRKCGTITRNTDWF